MTSIRQALKMRRVTLLIILYAVFVTEICCDTPANCTYEEVKGTWIFQLGKGGHDRTIECSKQCKVFHSFISKILF